jgi:TPP-dependent pyruvate/acetoin dehydrogenase alpha subunit
VREQPLRHGDRARALESVLDIASKAASYGIPAAAVDGMDILQVEEAARLAAASVRESGMPYFLELRTYRFRAHSMFDPELYRPKEEVETWKKRDPIEAFTRILSDRGLLDETEKRRIEEEVAREIEDAVAFAEAGTLEPIHDLTRFVVSERRASS